MKRTLGALMGLGLLVAGSSASAAVITFDPLPGGNGAPYAGHVEAGFTVTALTADWQQGFSVGNPVPSIFNFTIDGESVGITE